MAHHLLVFHDLATAQEVAAELVADGFDAVSTERGTDGSAEVAIEDPRMPVQDGASTVEGLKTRFQAIADARGGQYVESEPGQTTDPARGEGTPGASGSW